MRARITIAATLLIASSASAGLGDQLHKLLADDREQADAFGFSVAAAGTIAVVGARNDDDLGPSSGSAYLFDTATGRQLRKLLPDDGFSEDQFGTAVAICGTTVLVGAPRHNGPGADTGAVYVFDRDTGAQLATLTAEDATPGNFFGDAVAISGTTAVIGATFDDERGTAAGSAYLFDTATGTQRHKLLAADGDHQDHFGEAVAISGNRAVVGAPRASANGTDAGAAYLFDVATGEQIARLLPHDGEPSAAFGQSVAIDGNTVLVGAPRHADAGAAYLFDATTGEEIARIRSGAAHFGEAFGSGVALRGTTALVGANFSDAGQNNAGAAYLFDVARRRPIARLVAADGASFDSFGASVALGDAAAVIAAPSHGQDGIDSGAAYVFDAARCPADLDGGGDVDFEDLLRVLDAWGEEDEPEDLDGSGTVDFGDLLIVLDAWGPCA